MKNKKLLGLKEKRERLVSIINGFDSLIVAFSGGVDSAFLLAIAHKLLKKNVAAISATSPIHPSREIEYSKKFADNLGIKHILFKSREINHSGFMANKKDRCYICKKLLFEDILKIASDMGITPIAHGANIDDLDDFRPGLSAAEEMGVVAPLVDAGLSKDDIRLLSKDMNLSTWDKPAMACFATRIPYGTPLTQQALSMIEQAENTIIDLGFKTCRVRCHGKVARIEIDPVDFEKILNEKIRLVINNKLKALAFSYVALDMEGYVGGSMNIMIK
ncbi:MAG: ATP-dependent sacrificial sulfur transferase LarE [Deltaproteobacteria bacterium]|nr:ATP-dependent sacrificial sulfur transferase LarE [Deltaproteobacteria bacterium]